MLGFKLRQGLVGLSIVFLTMLFVNCVEQSFNWQDGNPDWVQQGSLLAWPEVDCSRSAAQKTQIFIPEEPTNQMEFPKVSPSLIQKGRIPAGTPLIIQVSRNCLNSLGSLNQLSDFTLEKIHQEPNLDNPAIKVELPMSVSVQWLESEAARNPCIVAVDEWIQMQLFSPNDPLLAQQGFLRTIRWDQVYPAAFNPYNGIKSKVKVGVIDTGVDYRHPDLMGNFISELKPTTNFNITLHGTHVAGLIGAVTHNGVGVASVAGPAVEIYSARASDDGNSINNNDVINGINQLVNLGVKVVNMSFGGPNRSSGMVMAMGLAQAQNVIFVVAAGNDNRNLDNFNVYPAKLSQELPNVITVGSYHVNENQSRGPKSSFSNFSSTFVTLLAPGSETRSGNPNGGLISTVPNGAYGGLQGTSMATPVVAGAIALAYALIQSRGFEPTLDDIRYFLFKSQPRDPLYGSQSQQGRYLDVKALLDEIAQDTGLALNENRPLQEARPVIQLAQYAQSVGIPAGTSFELFVEKSANSARLVKYRWYKNGQIIQGANGPRYVIRNAGLADKGVYHGEIYSGQTVVRTPPILVNVAECR